MILFQSRGYLQVYTCKYIYIYIIYIHKVLGAIKDECLVELSKRSCALASETDLYVTPKTQVNEAQLNEVSTRNQTERIE